MTRIFEWRIEMASHFSAAAGGGFGFDDGAFARWAGLTLVADEQVFYDCVDAGVLEAGKFRVFQE